MKKNKIFFNKNDLRKLKKEELKTVYESLFEGLNKGVIERFILELQKHSKWHFNYGYLMELIEKNKQARKILSEKNFSVRSCVGTIVIDHHKSEHWMELNVASARYLMLWLYDEILLIEGSRDLAT